jgi:hypothetical protein
MLSDWLQPCPSRLASSVHSPLAKISILKACIDDDAMGLIAETGSRRAVVTHHHSSNSARASAMPPSMVSAIWRISAASARPRSIEAVYAAIAVSISASSAAVSVAVLCSMVRVARGRWGSGDVSARNPARNTALCKMAVDPVCLCLGFFFGDAPVKALRGSVGLGLINREGGSHDWIAGWVEGLASISK